MACFGILIEALIVRFKNPENSIDPNPIKSCSVGICAKTATKLIVPYVHLQYVGNKNVLLHAHTNHNPNVFPSSKYVSLSS